MHDILKTLKTFVRKLIVLKGKPIKFFPRQIERDIRKLEDKVSQSLEYLKAIKSGKVIAELFSKGAFLGRNGGWRHFAVHVRRRSLSSNSTVHILRYTHSLTYLITLNKQTRGGIRHAPAPSAKLIKYSTP